MMSTKEAAMISNVAKVQVNQCKYQVQVDILLTKMKSVSSSASYDSSLTLHK